MEIIEDCLELLYGGEDDIKDKIEGSAKILNMCCHVKNLEQFLRNHQLVSALSRVLRDDFVKSAELSFNICRIFLAFANFKEMHHILSNHRIGSMVMTILDLELRRSRKLHEKIFDEINESTSRELRNRKDTVQSASHSLEIDRIVAKRQDRTIYVCLKTLLFLAEDNDVVRKMSKKGLVIHLCNCLCVESKRCVRLVLVFLKNLSIYEENVRDMLHPKYCIVEKLGRLIYSKDQIILISSMRVLFNLSFSLKCRDLIIQQKITARCVSLLKKTSIRATTVRLLYNMSGNSTFITQLADTSFTDTIVQLVINFPKHNISMELGALVINASFDESIAEQI
mmetsp:Transcript_24010/g.29492  ORF Transcript_24010/g.29492 Transcript_24010/m.29492 type:complete len:339 (-) Transcript_24010:13-1029(-)